MTVALQRAFAEASKLSDSEQDLIASRLMIELGSPDDHCLTDEFRVELDRRWADHLANPDDATPWEQVKAEALARNSQ